MTLQEYIPIVEKLKIFYKQDNFIPDKATSDAWFEMLKDLEAPAVMRSVDNYIKENRFPPTVADIRKEYCKLYEAYQTLIKLTRKEYAIACSYYPSMSMELEEETFEIYKGKLKKYPQAQWEQRTRKFRSDTIKYVQECERNHKEILDFRTYLNEQTI